MSDVVSGSETQLLAQITTVDQQLVTFSVHFLKVCICD